MNDSSITRTASDTLQAKASALWNGGYRPLSMSNNNEQEVSSEASLYEDWMRAFLSDGDKTTTTTVKRQTPLVHAGYALRMHAISSVVRNFVKYIQDVRNEADAQIILLGGGMDVTGLWAGQAFSNVICRVVEIDLPAVCVAKQKILQDKKLIDFNQPTATGPHVRRGKFANHAKTATTQYALVQVDLRNDSISWENVLKGLWEPQSPTLVISEVVLAYVGQEAMDWVLSSWATALQHPTSCLVLLEPMDPVTESRNGRTPTILHNYQKVYTEMFHAKLERGTQRKTDSDSAGQICFAPIGCSPQDVARRLCNAWPTVVAVSLANATESSGLGTIKEPFDEHAALLLHAQSYVVACAFPSSSKVETLFRRVLVPWLSTVAPVQIKEHLWVATIDRAEEETVKDLFVGFYADLCRTNRSVNKLVQGTFKKDLILTKIDKDREGIDFTCHFAKHYADRKGCFWVAIDAKAQRIAGFVALSKADPQAQGVLSKHANTYEVHRLFVVPEYRSQGVAGHLMDIVQQFSLTQVPPGTTVTLVARTLQILGPANRFYERRGFVLEERVPLPEVLMFCYMLRIHKPSAVDAT